MKFSKSLRINFPVTKSCMPREMQNKKLCLRGLMMNNSARAQVAKKEKIPPVSSTLR